MKNKRKCTNKYRSKTLEEDVNKGKNANKEDTKKELDSHSSSNNNDNLTQTTGQKKKKDRENKQLKRRNTDRDTNVFSTGGLKKQKAGDKAQSKNSTLEASDDRIHQDIQELHTKTANDELSPSKRKKVELSKEQSLKKQKLRDMLSRHVPEKESPAEQKGSAASGPEEEEKPEEAKLSRSDILRSRMEQRLESARFRYINELLYSSSSGDAKRMFQQDPEAFWVYHKGYTSQVQRWPVNPVDQIISYIQKK